MKQKGKTSTGLEKEGLLSMKRIVGWAIVLALACACGMGLAGCEQIGIGDEGDGVPKSKDAEVSTPAISTEGILRVGVDSSNAPFSTLVGDKLVGIDVDVAYALADELGLSAEVVDVGSEPERALSAGTVDVIMGVDTADSAATCWKSSPYLDTAVGLFATSSGVIMPTEASKPTIEAQESSMSAWEVTNQFGEDALRAVSDLRTAFADLESGSVTYVASDAIIGTYVTHTSAGRAQLIGLMQTPGGYCVGVDSSNKTLQGAVSEAVAKLVGTGMVSVVEAKWIGGALDLENLTYTDFSTKPTTSTSSSSSSSSSAGKVGANAVDLKDDGSTGEGNNAAIVEEGAWSAPSAEPATTATEPAPTYTDQNTTYVEPAPTYTDQNTAYVEPAPTYTDQNTAYVEPEQTYTDPNAGVVEPVAPVDDGTAGVDYTAGTDYAAGTEAAVAETPAA